MINNINLLNLNNDILNIIGDYVKIDNVDRMEKREKKFLNKLIYYTIY